MSLQSDRINRLQVDLFEVFLDNLRKQKLAEQRRVQRQLQEIEKDMSRLGELKAQLPPDEENPSSPNSKKPVSNGMFLFAANASPPNTKISPTLSPSSSTTKKRNRDLPFDEVVPTTPETEKDRLFAKKRRVTQNMEELQEAYFETKRSRGKGSSSSQDAMETFIRSHLQPCVVHTQMTSLAAFRHQTDPKKSSLIMDDRTINAIAFHSSGGHCAVGGNSRTIQIFSIEDAIKSGCKGNEIGNSFISPLEEYVPDGALGKMEGEGEEASQEMDAESVDGEGQESTASLPFPSTFLTCEGAVTGLGWHGVNKELLCSVDTRGKVMLWETQGACLLSDLGSHASRCRSIDFCLPEPDLLATSGDDSTVRIWSLSANESTSTIYAPGPVITAKWNPVLENQLTFVCADQKIYTYDIRMIDDPLSVSPAFPRTVPAIVWNRRDSLITQVSDGTIKAWGVNNGVLDKTPSRIYQGHTHNSQTSLGLACFDGHIASGSEDNSVYVYNASFSKPSFVHSFNSNLPSEDQGAFVSAVAWGADKTLVAGNSGGLVKVLAMQP
mmetsp:Transcript_28824/g.39894  ORF Transcript_28824/g.39894 Transcript_28824/m.39894 type:complete len:553 (-) Transcript_28824:18-1676(-)